MSGLNQFLQRFHQLENVVEVQAGRRFVKDKECVFAFAFEGVCKMLGEFKTLSFTAGQGRDRLSELEIVQTDFNERFQIAHDFLIFFEELEGFGNRHVEHFGNVGLFAVTGQFDFKDLTAIASAFAFRAA